jgi:hypothetical protein
MAYPEDFQFCTDWLVGGEDWNIGFCLEDLEVQHCDTRDELGQQRFIGINPKEMLNPDKSPDTFHEFLYPYETGEKCCSKSTISFHYVTVDEMYTFDFLIYKFQLFGTKTQI